MEKQHDTKKNDETLIENEETSKKNDETAKNEEKRTEETSPKKDETVEVLLNTEEFKTVEGEVEEEEFLDAVESLEDAIGLDQDLTVNDSMIDFLLNEENYLGDFAGTMEMERNKVDKKKLETELKTARKTIEDIRKLYKEKDDALKKCLIKVNKTEAEKLRLLKKLDQQKEELKDTREKMETVIEEANDELNNLQKENREHQKRIVSNKPSEEEDIMFACEKCDFASKTEIEMEKHVKVTHMETEIEVHGKLHKCNKCPTMFKMKERLENHMDNHLFLCFYKGCGAQTKTEQQMATHIDDVHLLCESGQHRNSETLSNKSNRNKTECRYFRQGRCSKGDQCDFKHVGRTFKCDKCSFTTTSTETLEVHVNSKHADKSDNQRGTSRSNSELWCKYQDEHQTANLGILKNPDHQPLLWQCG